ncbi:MAG: O-antigen ligase family protein [Oligoflexia bacterium]|nr:O-antigen ligase family protein [Oligoflexia bacterium]
MEQISTQRSRQLLVLGFSVYLVASLVSMAVMSLGAVFLFTLWVVAMGGPRGAWTAVKAEAANPRSKRYLRLTALLAVACIVSLVVAWIVPMGYGSRFVRVSFLKDLQKLWYLFWPLVLAAGLRALPESDRARALRAWLLVFATLSIVGIIQHFTGWPRPQVIPSSDPVRYHATMFLGHHLSVSSIFIFPFFAALDFLGGRGERLRARAVGLSAPVLLAIVALGLSGLFLTHARTLWAALPVGLVLWALWRLPRRWAGALVAALLVLGLAASQLPQIRGRFNSASFSFSFESRLELWRANLRFFEERPLVGAGWHHNAELSGYYQLAKLEEQGKAGQSVFSGHAHNNFLDFLGGTGLLGALAWLAWSVAVLAMAWRSRQAGIVCAWVVFHLNGLTQVNFWEGKVTHQLMIAVALTLVAAPRAPGARNSQ